MYDDKIYSSVEQYCFSIKYKVTFTLENFSVLKNLIFCVVFNVIGFKQSMVIQIGKTSRFGYRVLIKASFRIQPVRALRIRIMSVFKKYETKKKHPKN